LGASLASNRNQYAKYPPRKHRPRYKESRMRYTFESEQWLPYPVEQVFAFFANPENLPKLMPPWQQTRIERCRLVPAPPSPQHGLLSTPAASAGTSMTLTFRPFPLSPFRISWEAEISKFAWNDHFCDIQHSGPFAYWHHCHYVSAATREGTAGTIVRDHVVYAMPFGMLGRIAQRIAGNAQFRSIFNYRHRRTAELLAAEH
jgi:ligand-binding SRPBCC domain-containing protein